MRETRLPQSAFDALVRMDGYERQRLEAITAPSAQLTVSVVCLVQQLTLTPQDARAFSAIARLYGCS